ncbi:NUDIX hydrolase [Pseudofulvimonas gallinarii]|jgi:8-oxo-dGTP diphosphatase|uniref:NUDIX hydrolase n=1 Tax=Pseudofulvimonas gallinarii TaxID=634155 RepID=UPI000F46E946|nr:NUDIX domain-containing protein [Pseudofulvimonas gallinarii]THD13580.1 NUDIX hydrolase [Pseudofulvimonas gallinarii]
MQSGSNRQDARVRTVAAVIVDGQGRVLLVRKRGSTFFIQPGGKREPDEASLVTLARELDEELGVTLRVGSAKRLGEFEHVAVNEPGRSVQAEVFRVEIDGEPQACAEIEELAWVDPRAPHAVKVAPLSAEKILPRLLAGA